MKEKKIPWIETTNITGRTNFFNMLLYSQQALSDILNIISQFYLVQSFWIIFHTLWKMKLLLRFFELILIPFFKKCIKMNTSHYHTSFKLKISAINVKQMRVAGKFYKKRYHTHNAMLFNICIMCDFFFHLLLLYIKVIFCNPNTSNAFLNPINDCKEIKD